jgi:hypothetical protein
MVGESMVCSTTYEFGTMSGVMSKKKLDAENRQFQDNWTEDFACVFVV